MLERFQMSPETAVELIHESPDGADAVLKHSDHFTSLNEEVARALIERGMQGELAGHLELFCALSMETANELLALMADTGIRKHIKSFRKDQRKAILGKILI